MKIDNELTDYLSKRKEAAKLPLTEHDWVQLEQAAIGCTSGIENWPHLRLAIQKVVTLKGAITDMSAIANHEEASDLAEIKRGTSNLARCYLALQALLKDKEIEQLEMRFALGSLYAGNKLYMDDGEMQDATVHPFIDWKRDAWGVIKEKLHRRMMDQLAKERNERKPGAAATPWGTDPWTRAGGDCLCSCGKEYRLHKTETGPGYGSCGDEILVLQRLCDGTLVHL